MWAGDLLWGINTPEMHWCEPGRAPEEDRGKKADGSGVGSSLEVWYGC